MRRLVFAAAAASILLAAQVAGVAAPIVPLVPFGLLDGEGNFSSSCGYSHRLPDDPIVAPGRPGSSHSHDFFGNRSTDAFSTYASLRVAAAICHRSGDKAAYWVPTLYQFGRALTPRGAVAYYFTAGKSPGSIRAFPRGLRVVAGNGRATAPQPRSVTSWSCAESSTRSSEIPLCTPGHELRLHVRFPDCWNGRDLDSADHRSHLAYASRGSCPAGYGVALPLLSFAATYPTQGGPGITLASGSSYTAHADFLNSWDQSTLEGLVRKCLNASRDCGLRE